MTVKELMEERLNKEASFFSKEAKTKEEEEEEKARKRDSRSKILKALGVIAGTGAVGAGGYAIGNNRGFVRGSKEGYTEGMDDLQESLRNSLGSMAGNVANPGGWLAKSLSQPISSFLDKYLASNARRLGEARR